MDDKKEIKVAKVVKVANMAKVVKIKNIKDYYSVREWAGRPQYKCNLCPFDSLDEKEAKAHISDIHIPKPEKLVKVKILDVHGIEITSKKK